MLLWIPLVDLFLPASMLEKLQKNPISHVLNCLSVMGKPEIIKTDNGPGYTGKKFQEFCRQLQIKHVTGIPYSPQGQGIVKRAHLTIKNGGFITHERLSKKYSSSCLVCS